MADENKQPKGLKQDVMDEDVGGVQGSPPPEPRDTADAQGLPLDEASEEPVPDAGEIEWARAVVKKPPSPE